MKLLCIKIEWDLNQNLFMYTFLQTEPAQDSSLNGDIRIGYPKSGLYEVG